MSAYTNLCQLADEIALLQSTASVLSWDQETYMPNAALAYRARQLGYLSGKAHVLFTSKKFQTLLDQAEAEVETLTPLAQANIREWRRLLNRATKLSRKLVEQFSETTSRAKAAWAEARQQSHFKTFAPHLEKVIKLTRKMADLWGYTGEPYDALLDENEPATTASEISILFDDLRPRMVALAKEAVARSASIPADVLAGDYPIAQQQILNREVAESLGFDFEAGRIDTTAHPFCTHLGPKDERLTTRYNERDFTSSLFGVMHEAGHGLYEQGLPADDYGLPSGTATSLGIHESQSRLWENHVGRSRPFWEKWLPRAKELFPGLHLSVDEMYAAVNRAEFSFIRVEADGATYDLHVMLRFKIERMILNGEIKVKELPSVWNDEFRALFGITPPDDAHGCLQDIHWSMGGLGYFPTYTLGNLNAAQLFHAAREDLAIRKDTDHASYATLLNWLRENVHRWGSQLPARTIMERATGAATDARWHLEYLRERYLAA